MLPPTGGVSTAKVSDYKFEVTQPRPRTLLAVSRIETSAAGRDLGEKYETEVEEPLPEKGSGLTADRDLAAERLADLQRLQAEYVNYRKRVERDRDAVVRSAKASVVNDLLPLLDDLERAEQHGDLTGAFKAVGDKLISGLQRAGLESFGTEGEAFDPSVHEAVQHNTSPDVAGPTVTVVMRRGYRFGDRVLRAALVGVTDHEPAPAPENPPPAGGAAGNGFDEYRQQ